MNHILSAGGETRFGGTGFEKSGVWRVWGRCTPRRCGVRQQNPKEMTWTLQTVNHGFSCRIGFLIVYSVKSQFKHRNSWNMNRQKRLIIPFNLTSQFGPVPDFSKKIKINQRSLFRDGLWCSNRMSGITYSILTTYWSLDMWQIPNLIVFVNLTFKMRTNSAHKTCFIHLKAQ